MFIGIFNFEFSRPPGTSAASASGTRLGSGEPRERPGVPDERFRLLLRRTEFEAGAAEHGLIETALVRARAAPVQNERARIDLRAPGVGRRRRVVARRAHLDAA